ncbi:MAG: DNA polymerase [Candidatus Portnoybacteria bacterium]|nr:DNA polymerase [Candidatus Portnoybacteria bacterium]
MSLITSNGGLMDLPTPNYTYIKSTEEALRHVEFIERHPIVEFDTEATGLDPLKDRVVLMQFGVGGKSFVFDVRDGRVDPVIFKNVFASVDNLKLIQNALFDVEMVKSNFKLPIKRLYDPMLAEQLLYLGLNPKANLQHMVSKYLHLFMPKDVGSSFANYDQEYEDYQIRYAANDVVVLREIYNQQLLKLQKDNLVRVARLEFEFVDPLSEMELNGITLDVPQWRGILDNMIVERDRLQSDLSDLLSSTVAQSTLFGVNLLNLDSPTQLVKALNRAGVPVEGTDVKQLAKYAKHPVVKTLLEYRKFEKFVTTYGDPLINRIHPTTGRLHTNFRQMVATGRLSSFDPNLQNIPKEQRYRSCFVAPPGYKFITADMSQAELRILAEYSRDPEFLEAYRLGEDLHIRTACGVFNKTKEEVMLDESYKKSAPEKYVGYRNKTKSINFGLCYGLTYIGLALRIGCSENEAKDLIDAYFKKYSRVKSYLESSAKFAVLNRYSLTASGRRRYYQLPPSTDPNFNKFKGSVERKAKNHPIQGSNADTVKQAMIFTTERIKGYDARLILTVHDEIVVEVRDDQVEEVKPIVEKAVVDGFAEFFHVVKMETDGMVGNCWLKG